MKILVCGDREWKDKGTILRRLKNLAMTDVVIEGAARGADSIAGQVARDLWLDVEEFPADWNKHGRSAGPIRNRQMLDQRPDLVIAFHSNIESSRGTKDCVKEARRRGIAVEIITGAP